MWQLEIHRVYKYCQHNKGPLSGPYAKKRKPLLYRNSALVASLALQVKWGSSGYFASQGLALR
jgi:hypothetical protein